MTLPTVPTTPFRKPFSNGLPPAPPPSKTALLPGNAVVPAARPGPSPSSARASASPPPQVPGAALPRPASPSTSLLSLSPRSISDLSPPLSLAEGPWPRLLGSGLRAPCAPAPGPWGRSSGLRGCPVSSHLRLLRPVWPCRGAAPPWAPAGFLWPFQKNQMESNEALA